MAVSAAREPTAAAAEAGRAAERERFFRCTYPDFWYDVEGGDYAIFDVYPMPRAQIAALRTAAARAWRIFTRAAPVLRALPDAALTAIGVPETALAISRLHDPHAGESVVARFDFALTDAGPKLLELNAETPFFLWESYEIAGAVAAHFGYADPNVGESARLRAAIARVAGLHGGRVAVTAYNTWREDWFSAQFAARIAGAAFGRRVDTIALHELRIAGGALRDGRGTPIDVLWRLYPLEHFARDRAGPELFALVERGALRLINPPSALLLQNKAALAIIWDLAERGVWFDAAERAAIRDYFLPTSLDAPDDDAVYVRKPVFGREGSSIAIMRGATTLAASERQQYRSQPMVYQRFAQLSQTHGGNAIATCFVVDGVPSAIGMRVGGTITDVHARFLPVGVARENGG